MYLYKQLLYFISAVIIITLAIQVYTNFQQFQAGKQRLHSEMQMATDQALDNYYIDLAEKNTVGFAMDQSDPKTQKKLDSLLKRIDISNQGKKGFDSLDTDNITDIKVFAGSRITQMDTFFDNIKVSKKDKKQALRHFLNGNVNDSLNDLAKLTSRIIIAITTDTLNLKELSPYIKEELLQRNILLPFGFVFKNNSGDKQIYNAELNRTGSYPLISRSAYLPKKSSFILYYNEITPIILKRSLLPITLSAILIAAVIGCLLFLLRIINKQKQLSELKNDLISNITHEFKTPISVIHVALEGMENFNKENDPQKNRNYLNTSKEQLSRLNVMVEKLLETALLEGNKIKLDKSYFYIDEVLNRLILKYQDLETAKNISFSKIGTSFQFYGDSFHIENALNNILDNAVKYGGNYISVSIVDQKGLLQIEIKDDGNSLTQEQTKHIFEKFYRVPKGNTHDVKGYGIGLYYTKNIIEKHEGTIEVFIKQGTIFKISLPHGL